MTREICLLAFSAILVVTVRFSTANSDMGDPPPSENDNMTMHFNMDDRFVPSKYQNSYPLVGLRCFPEGVRLPCDCDTQYLCPCCVDYENDECYAPTYYEWSDWAHCSLHNELCEESDECRIKYDLVQPRSWMNHPVRRRRDLEGEEPQKSPMSHKNGCQVQRLECRLRRLSTWASWSETGECSSECGVGVFRRERECLDALTNETIAVELCEGGADAAVEEEYECNTDACRIFSLWQDYGRCYESEDADCVILQKRSCDVPANLSLPSGCDIREAPCELNCFLLGQSGYIYGEWEGCNATCSPGVESRVGECVYLIDNYPSTDCDSDEAIQYRECESGYCRNYTEWEGQGCSVECGTGTEISNRSCIDGGTTPAGCLSESRDCNEHPCLVNVTIIIGTGGVVDAGTEATINLTIHGSIWDYVITVQEDNVFQRGQNVSLFFENVSDIGTVDSITIGHDNSGENPSWYLDFVMIQVDSVEYNFPCGTWFDSAIGDLQTVRTLEPGVQCHQENFQINWLAWGPCNTNCTPGNRTRQGVCLDVATQQSSDKCVEGETDEQTMGCNPDFCDLFDDWLDWGDCLGVCGDGVQSRTRSCDGSGDVAPGCGKESRVCDTNVTCVEVGDWGTYGACSSSCSPGLKRRTRGCFEQGTNTSAQGCVESLEEFADCNENLCTSYTDFTAEDTTLCRAERLNDSCTARHYENTRVCNGTGDVPDGCLTNNVECTGNSSIGDYKADILVAFENFLTLTPGAIENCDSSDPSQLDDVKNFLYRFICSYNTFMDMDVSRFAFSDKPQGEPKVLKEFDEPEMFDAIEAMAPACTPGSFPYWFLKYKSLTKREGVSQLIIIIVSYREDGQLLTDTNNFKNSMSLIRPGGIPEYAIISTYVPSTDAARLKLHRFACADPDLNTATCDRLIGSIFDDEAVVLQNLFNLLD